MPCTHASGVHMRWRANSSTMTSDFLLVTNTLSNNALNLCFEGPEHVLVGVLILLGTQPIPNFVKVLTCIHRPKQHAEVALDDEPVRAIHLYNAGKAVLLLAICVQEKIFGRISYGHILGH